MTQRRPFLPNLVRLPNRIQTVPEAGSADAVAPTGNADVGLRFTVSDAALA